MKYQRLIQFFLVWTLLLTTDYAGAKSNYELEAAGKNEAAALGNLKMKALRTEIARHFSQDEIKSNAKNIRTEILLKIDDFVSEEGKISYTHGENKVIAAGRISVDDEKILVALGKSPLAESNEANTNASGNSSPGDEKFSSASGDTSPETVNHETNATAGGDSKFIEVQAEGIGESKTTALKNAWSEAVRQAVGVYLISSEKVEDDELVENIATYSKGQVESYKMLKSEKLTDGWHVVIQAKIEKDLLEEEVQKSEINKQIFSFDESNEVVKKSTKEEKKKNAADVILSINRLDMEDAIIYRSELLKEKVDNKNVIRHYIGLDVKKFLSKIDQLSKILEKIAVTRKPFYFNNQALKANKIAIDFEAMFDSMKNVNYGSLTKDDSGLAIFRNDMAFKGLSNETEYKNSNKDSDKCVVLANSVSKLTIYCFDARIQESIKCLLPKGFDLVFKVEKADGEIIAISNSYSIFFAPEYSGAGNVCSDDYECLNSNQPILLLTPYFGMKKTDKYLKDKYLKDKSFLYAFNQFFELSDEEKLKTKQLSASYEITNPREPHERNVCIK